jgi:transposase-like protein
VSGTHDVSVIDLDGQVLAKGRVVDGLEGFARIQNIRLEQDRLCCLLLVGVRADGHKELVAVSDRYRESTESWSELPRDLKRLGIRAPVLAIGDGALGFWGALRAGSDFPEEH